MRRGELGRARALSCDLRFSQVDCFEVFTLTSRTTMTFPYHKKVLAIITAFACITSTTYIPMLRYGLKLCDDVIAIMLRHTHRQLTKWLVWQLYNIAFSSRAARMMV